MEDLINVVKNTSALFWKKERYRCFK